MTELDVMIEFNKQLEQAFKPLPNKEWGSFRPSARLLPEEAPYFDREELGVKK